MSASPCPKPKVDGFNKAVSPKSLARSSSNRGRLLPATSFRAVNDYNLSQLVFDLYMAVISGCGDLVRHILTSHPDIDMTISVKGATVLSMSLYKRHFHIFNMLMKHHERNKKFDLNKPSTDHLNRIEPPIITACRMHFFEGVVALVNAGAEIDATDNERHTALWVASRQQMPDLVEYLISNGASVNKTDRYFYTPLFTGLLYRVSSIIIKLLILNGSSLEGPRHPAYTQRSPLFWAIKYRNMEIVRLMLSAGVPVSEIRRVRQALITENEGDQSLLEMLLDHSKSPQSLKQICRHSIRSYFIDQHFGKLFVQRIKLLPLPPILKQYLLLR